MFGRICIFFIIYNYIVILKGRLNSRYQSIFSGITDEKTDEQTENNSVTYMYDPDPTIGAHIKLYRPKHNKPTIHGLYQVWHGWPCTCQHTWCRGLPLVDFAVTEHRPWPAMTEVPISNGRRSDINTSLWQVIISAVFYSRSSPTCLVTRLNSKE